MEIVRRPRDRVKVPSENERERDGGKKRNKSRRR